MAKTPKPLRYLWSPTAKGKRYHYAWRSGPRIIAEFGSAEFAAEYAEHHRQRQSGDADRVRALCGRFRASRDWTSIGDKTRQNWSPWLDRIQVKFGDLRIAQFDRPAIRPIIREWHHGFAATPRSADIGLEVLSRLMSFASEEGRISVNPVFGMKRLYKANRAALIWTTADLDELAKHASPEIMYAARLAALTGLRQGDLLRLSWSHIGARAIEIRTRKSGETVTAVIPMYGALRDHLATIPKRATTVLTNTDHKPWATGFGSSFGKAKRKAGIDLHFHDLRGTAATRFFAASLTIREIAQVMGWSEDHVEGIINRYVKRDQILIDRIQRMENGAGTDSVKPTVKPAGSPV